MLVFNRISKRCGLSSSPPSDPGIQTRSVTSPRIGPFSRSRICSGSIHFAAFFCSPAASAFPSSPVTRYLTVCDVGSVYPYRALNISIIGGDVASLGPECGKVTLFCTLGHVESRHRDSHTYRNRAEDGGGAEEWQWRWHGVGRREGGADVFLPLPFYGGAIKIDPRVLRWLS